jgi:predicted  nucleic acid-binding Zn-ribbon protein
MVDINTYKQDNLDKRVILDFGAYIFDNSDVQESVSLEQCVNPSGDFVVGTAATTQLDFKLNNLYQLIPKEAINKKEFLYKMAPQTERTNLKKVYHLIRKDVICLNGSIAYAGDTTLPYLTMWDVEENIMLDNPDQPPQTVRSLFIVDGVLYCGHDDAPYLTAYRISGDKLVKITSPTLNAFSIHKIQSYNGRQKAFNLTGNLLKEYVTDLYDMKVIDLWENTFEFLQVGKFIVDKSERKNDNDILVTGYDYLSKTDVIIDDWNATITYPITAGKLLQSLCNWLGIELASSSFLNSDFVIQKNYNGENVTGRQIIQWVSQLAASFVTIDAYGRLELRWYSEKNYLVDESVYTDVTVAEYMTQTIDKVQIRTTENDVGVIVPPDETKTNAYIIENNPLMYAEADAELRPAAEKIFNALKNLSYTPCTVKTVWGNPFVRAGDIITVRTRKGQTLRLMIMTHKLTGVRALKSEFSATGNEIRDVQANSVNQSIQQLRGKTNELHRDIEETRSELKDTANQLQTEIRQTAEEIRLEAEDTKNNLQAQITVNAKEIATKVTEDDVYTLIKQSPEEVQIAFNKIALNIIKILSNGFHFYNSGKYIGMMGTDANDGLVFNLEEGSYMAWNRSGEGRMVYYPYDMGTGKEAGLHTSNIYVDIVNLNSTLYMNGNNIENANSIKVNRINNTNFDDWKSDVNSELSSLSRRISALENKSSAE